MSLVLLYAFMELPLLRPDSHLMHKQAALLHASDDQPMNHHDTPFTCGNIAVANAETTCDVLMYTVSDQCHDHYHLCGDHEEKRRGRICMHDLGLDAATIACCGIQSDELL